MRTERQTDTEALQCSDATLSSLQCDPQPQTSRAGLWRFAAENLALAAAYWGISHLDWIVFRGLGVLPMPLWPAAGLALVAAVIGSWRLAPGIALGAILANRISLSAPWGYACCIGVMNTLGPLLAAAIIRRRMEGKSWSRWGWSDLNVILFAAVFLAPLITAIGGIGAKWLLGIIPMASVPQSFFRWWLSHSIGTLLLAPPLFVLADRGRVSAAGSRDTIVLYVQRATLVAAAFVWLVASLFDFFYFRVGQEGFWSVFLAVGHPQAMVNRLSFVSVIAVGGFVLSRLLSHLVVSDRLAQAAAKDLRSSEERFRTLFETMAQGVVYQDANGRIFAANPAAERILGHSLAQMQGRNSSDPGWKAVHEDGSAFPGEDHPAMLALRTGQAVRDVVMGVENPGTGRRVWILVNAVPQFLSGARLPFQVYATFEDISDRKRAEEMLREGEARLRAIVDQAPFGAHSYELRDADRLVLVGANRAADRILGIDHAPLLGRSIEEAFPGLLGSGVPDAYRRLAAEEGSIEDEQVHYEQEKISGAFAIHAFHTGPRRMTVFFRDITERKKAEAALRETEARYRSLFNNALEGIFQTRPEGSILAANPALAHMLGYGTPDELIRELQNLAEQAYVDPGARGEFRRLVEEAGTVSGFECELRRKDGGRIWASMNARVVRDEQGRTLCYEGSIEDITVRRQAEAVRRLDESRLETLLRLSHMTRAPLDQIAAFALEEAVRLTQSEIGYVAFANQDETVLTMHAWSAAAMQRCRTKETPRDYLVAQTGLWGEPIRQRRAIITNDYAAPSPLKKGTPEGHVPVRRHLGVPVFDGDRIVIVAGVGNKATSYDDNDIRQITLLMGGMWQILKRQLAEQEKEKLQDQLLQAQKMESIGRLAGGVAHDFNNMLQAILGNTALAVLDLPPGSPARESLEEVQKSAERSADLTRQLLAFARKQTIAPKVLVLNDTVAGMLKMLRRLIGEDIDLVWIPGPALWQVRMDPSQVDQILANLCVNARDAILEAGKVTIETSNVTLDSTYVASHPEAVPGDYVVLTVSDTGRGMDKETRAHLFEPFFTTKEVGKGTGLGLATVFGIVKQNAGLISVYSEPDRGTTFKIYLPRVDAPPSRQEDLPGSASLRGTETILLVEDEAQVLNLGRRILEQHGYAVLAASNPADALAKVEQHQGPVHLLITDVVMPRMNGKELRERLQTRHPSLRCLFMSGYTANVIAHHGILDDNLDFLQKPFTIQTLTRKVREILMRKL